jgi:hypothetical protein
MQFARIASLLLAATSALTPAIVHADSHARFGIGVSEGASLIYDNAGDLDGVTLTQSVDLYWRPSARGFVDLGLSANINFNDLPGVWFGVHPGYRHVIAGPLFVKAGADLYGNPAHTGIGAHGGLGVMGQLGRLRLHASVVGAKLFDWDVLALRSSAGLSIDL